MEEDLDQPAPLEYIDPELPAPLTVEDSTYEEVYMNKLTQYLQTSPTTNTLPFMELSPSISPSAEMIYPYQNFTLPTEVSPYPLTPTTPTFQNLHSPMLPYQYFGLDFGNLNSMVGKKKHKRATGKVSYDKDSGKKVITAATCVACFRSKKKCIYRVGSDSCTLCAKRNQPCIKRIDRRCQKIWTETGRTMGTFSKPKKKEAEKALDLFN